MSLVAKGKKTKHTHTHSGTEGISYSKSAFGELGVDQALRSKGGFVN